MGQVPPAGGQPLPDSWGSSRQDLAVCVCVCVCVCVRTCMRGKHEALEAGQEQKAPRPDYCPVTEGFGLFLPRLRV